MSPGRFVRVERFEHALRVTVDRPEALNAIDGELLDELAAALTAAAADAAARVVILTGAGDRAFIAGADVKEMSRLTPLAARTFAVRGQRLTALVEEMEKPVIAAVNGVALGGGCELAIACDVRVAGDRARFGQPEVGLGVIPGWGGTFRLARIVGEGVARELIFTGRALSAEEALRVGLVTAVVPHAALADEALKLASTLASRGPVALAHAKRSMSRSRWLDAASAAELEADLFALCFTTDDQKEGMSAFVEKRPPRFQGR